MTDVEITKLIERFMAGETTLEEEKMLSDFFRTSSAAEKPIQISDEDWLAFQEMFQILDGGFEKNNKKRERRLWLLTAAAAAAAIVLVAVLSIRERNQASMLAEVDTGKEHMVVISASPEKQKPVVCAADEQEVMLPSDTLKDCKKNDSATTPRSPGNGNPRKLPYSPSIPRHCFAQAAKTHGVSVDSLAVALSEVEYLIEAATVYQEIRISELCDVEYEEYY